MTMAAQQGTILTLNAGSSSIKFALFAVTQGEGDDIGLDELARGQVEGLGAVSRLRARDRRGTDLARREFAANEMTDHASALAAILDLIEACFPAKKVIAVGHRVVHGGMHYTEPVVIDAAVQAALESLVPLAPLHQPHNLSGVRAAQSCFPTARQVACFDTAFHRSHPWVNDAFALPRSFYDQGIRRYGFHGLSYEYITEEMARRVPQHANGRMVIAHLGNGASLCAVRGGRSIGSTMGFTALDGLPMGTRCGQLDPGVVLYLIGEKGMSVDAVGRLLYEESGLKGLSGQSQDMRELEASDRPEAEQAIEYFIARIRCELGAMTAIIGGLDALVFCGGIGEHSARVRQGVASGFEWLGLELDPVRNRQAAAVISAELSRVHAFVVPTDEEVMIARHASRLLARSAVSEPVA